MNFKSVAIGAAFAAIGFSAALAQQVGPSASSFGGQPTGSTVGEVVVTAEKRVENIQEVPVTLAVVEPKQLDIQNIQTTTDLIRAFPALTVDDEGNYQIRSIGTEGYGRSAESSVSVVLDGVALGRALTNSMYDLDHVEVLDGPQGTLFGKNADSGVVNILTHAPDLGRYEAFGHVDAGSHDYVHSYVVANIPIGDTLALRLSYHHDSTGHIVYNTVYHEWDYNTDDGVRARLLWQPNDKLSVNLEADYQKLASNGVNGVADFAGVAVYTYAPPGSALAQTLASCGIVASPTNNQVCANSLYAKGVNTGDTYGRWNGGTSLTVDYRLPGDFTLTSITAVRQSANEDFDVHADVAGEFSDTLPQNILDRNLVPFFNNAFSEEDRIASPASDPINFVAGVYFSDTAEHDEIDQAGQFGYPLGDLELRRFINIDLNQINYAGFGQVNWQATSKLKLFAGGRVTHDDVSDYSYNSFPGAYPGGTYIYEGNTGGYSVLPVNSCTLAGGVPYPAYPAASPIIKACPAGTSIYRPGVVQETGYSGIVGAQYQINSQLMVFTDIAEGYKGPFINESVTYTGYLSQQPLLVKAERPTDIELGIKATVHRFAIDVSAFTDKIDNFQTTLYVPVVGSALALPNFIQGNAPHAITRGVQFSFFGPLFEGFDLSGGLIYDDAHFNNGFAVECLTGAACPALHQLPYAPKLKATIAGEYDHRLIQGVNGFVQSDLAYSGPYPYGSAPDFPLSPARYLVGARLGVRLDNDKWDVAVFCRNCLDERNPIGAAPDGFDTYDGGIVGNKFATYDFLTIDSYRVVGVTVDAKY